MVNKTLLFIIALLMVFAFGCGSDKREPGMIEAEVAKPKVKRDLPEIKKEGKLKVLTTYSSTSYFLYRGVTMGYEYEMLQRLAKHLGIELEIHVSKNLNNLITELNNGDVDLVAHELTVTAGRKEKVHFTDYLFLTHQVLVQKKPDNWRKMHWRKLKNSLIHDVIELIGDTVSVRKNSSYYYRLKNLSKEIGGEIYIDTLHGSIPTTRIIEMVAEGKIKYTVADDYLASISASYYPVLDISVPVSFSQRVAWAVRSNSPELEKEINKWLREFRKEVDYNVIYNKYFKNNRSFKVRSNSDYLSLNKNNISKYDGLIKKYAKNIGWDWRLLSALVYQESQFDHNKKSWAGAKGLMQIMPATAKELGIKNNHKPEESLMAGTKYLKIIGNRFSDVEDSVQRIKFTLAAYNCGYHHIYDARTLAEKEGLDRNIWDDNVENMILKLSYRKYYLQPEIKYGYVNGREPYNYVRQIFKRYNNYTQFINR